MMKTLAIISQIIISSTILHVWIFKHEYMSEEFKRFGFPSWFKNFVGITKVILAILLIIGIWNTSIISYISMPISFLMLLTVVFHIKKRDKIIQTLPSLILWALSIIILAYYCY